MTSPSASRTGADTDATPASRCADRLGPAAPADLGQGAGAELRLGQDLGQPGVGAPGAQHLRAGAGRQRQPAADRHGRAQPGGPFGDGDAEPLAAVDAVELGALAGLVANPGQDGRGRDEQRIGHRRGQFGQPRARAGTARPRRGRAAGGRAAPSRAGGRSPAGCRWRRPVRPATAVRSADGGQDGRRFVDYADAAMLG